MRRILLTGAAGNVGRAIRPFLADRYEHVVLSDLETIDDTAANESFLQGDITDADFTDRVVDGVDGVVHLAALVGPDYNYEDVLSPSLTGCVNIFESCRKKGVRRVVYASSHHAVGFLPRDRRVDHTTPPRPDGWYGISKVFGEAVCAYYADKFGFRVMAIRIGSVAKQVMDERRLRIWTSPCDLAQLVGIGLSDRVEGFEIVYGASDLPDSLFDNRNAQRLGYRPRDRALDHLADPEIPGRAADPSTPAGRVVGGPFAEATPRPPEPEPGPCG